MPKVTSLVTRTSYQPCLMQGRTYEVIGISRVDFRIVNESGDAPLYPKEYFADTDIVAPDEWVHKDFGEGEYCHEPVEFSTRGFFEHLADRRPAEVEIYQAYLDKYGLGDCKWL